MSMDAFVRGTNALKCAPDIARKARFSRLLRSRQKTSQLQFIILTSQTALGAPAETVGLTGTILNETPRREPRR